MVGSLSSCIVSADVKGTFKQVTVGFYSEKEPFCFGWQYIGRFVSIVNVFEAFTVVVLAC